jgi:hypothetical protein
MFSSLLKIQLRNARTTRLASRRRMIGPGGKKGGPFYVNAGLNSIESAVFLPGVRLHYQRAAGCKAAQNGSLLVVQKASICAPCGHRPTNFTKHIHMLSTDQHTLDVFLKDRLKNAQK